jgi:hypothetical protein
MEVCQNVNRFSWTVVEGNREGKEMCVSGYLTRGKLTKFYRAEPLVE